MKKWQGICPKEKHIKEGVGFELYSKGADRIVKQCEQIQKYASDLAKATRANEPLKKRVKILKDLKRWQDSIRIEINQLEDDIDNLEGF